MKFSPEQVALMAGKAQFFPIQQRWQRLKTFFGSPQAEQIWRPNISDFAFQKIADPGLPVGDDSHFHDKTRYRVPMHFDGLDWRCEIPGKHPRFWDYACARACHWLVDMCLWVATNAYPKTAWRIIRSQKHSTVWNGSGSAPVLFEVNSLALDVSARDAFEAACHRGRVLNVGQYLQWASMRYGERLPQ